MTDIDKVWVVEEGDYEARGIVGIYRSLEGAVAGIKETFKPPYIVSWDDIGNGYSLVGHFEDVSGYSTKHTACFGISPMDLK